jgi:hypothetical protein
MNESTDMRRIHVAKIHGVTNGFTWAHFCGVVLMISGLGFVGSVIAGSTMSIAFAIVFGFCLVALSILEAGRK